MRKQEKTAIIVAFVDLLSIVVKFFLAAITGSLSIMADAWHSFGDLITTIMVFIALILDRKEKIKDADAADKQARFIRRSSWEPRACVIIGIALAAVAARVFKEVFLGGPPETIRYPLIAAAIVLILMLFSYIRFRFEESVGKETGSPALVADAYHSKVDIYSLILVLVSLLSEQMEFRIDRWMAGVIALMILAIALKTLYNAFSIMLTRSNQVMPEERTVEDRAIMFTMGYIHTKKDHLISRLIDHFDLKNHEKTKKLRRNFIRSALILAVFIWIISGFYIVSYSEQAIVERLGKPIDIKNPVGPGLHYDWPRPISRIKRIDTDSVRWMRLGYVTKERTDIILWTKAHYLKEYSVLTGDGAIVELAANLHYRVVDVGAYLYSAVEPESQLELMSYEILCRLAAQHSLFDILAYGRKKFEQTVTESIQSSADAANLGIEIVQICFLDVHPPMEVAPAFEDVISAQEDLETSIEQARGYYKETLPLTTGEAASMIIQAESYQKETVEKAAGQANAFLSVTAAFKEYKSINKLRIRHDALGYWLPGKPLWLIDSRVSKRPVDLFISQSNPNKVSGVMINDE
ncbi:MAG: cation transporter [bacterium]